MSEGSLERNRRIYPGSMPSKTIKVWLPNGKREEKLEL